MVVYADLYWFILSYFDLWWLMVAYGGLWGLMVAYGIFGWLFVANGGLCGYGSLIWLVVVSVDCPSLLLVFGCNC
jgi:hypothetical protein